MLTFESRARRADVLEDARELIASTLADLTAPRRLPAPGRFRDRLAYERERLAGLRALDILDTPPEALFDDVAQAAAAIFRAPIGLVSLVDKNRQWFKSRVGLDVPETPRCVSFCSRAIYQEGMLVVLDAQTDPHFSDNPLVTEAPFIRFYVGAPILDLAGYPIGTVCAIDSQPREQVSDADLAALNDLVTLLQREFGLRSVTEKLRRIESLLGSPSG